MSTGIGSLIALFAKKDSKKTLSLALGFSAGVMIYISFVEIFMEGNQLLASSIGNNSYEWVTALSFFGGMFLIFLINLLIPEDEDLSKFSEAKKDATTDSAKLMRIGVLTALAISIHNLPEGIATFFSAINDPKVTIPIALAIAIHNIPEGIAVSVPIYYATGSRSKAFWYSFASGLTEPLGALLAYLLLMPFINDLIMGIILTGVAGIMIFISLNELFPTAIEYGGKKQAIIGMVCGMAVMSLSLILLH